MLGLCFIKCFECLERKLTLGKISLRLMDSLINYFFKFLLNINSWDYIPEHCQEYSLSIDPEVKLSTTVKN